MLETLPQRKVKISLEDYNYRQDIENRLLMGQFTSLDLEVLEEILYSSISIPIRKLMKSLDLDEISLQPILQKLSKTGLFQFDTETISVDKEMRKYFESQILKFDPDFTPGMEFLQSLLRKVPIHLLPTWYSIPRTSNNIFDSLVEKYLLSPQIFQRYFMEIHFPDPALMGIMKRVYASNQLQVLASDLIAEFNLTHEQFEEHLLTLEFNLVCCLGYCKIGNEWKEVVTPYHEWREYQLFLKETETKPVANESLVQRLRPEEFSFVDDISTLLNIAKKQPIPLIEDKEGRLLPQSESLLGAKVPLQYLDRLITKVRILKLADVVNGRLYALESAHDWLDMKVENRAIVLYRHPLNRLESDQIPAHLCTEKNLREAEKSLLRVLNSGWVYFDDFINGVIVPLGDDSHVLLKKQGKHWRYTLPTYSEEERSLIKSVVYDWLFEVGITAIGVHDGRDCFSVTPFGQSLFGR